MTEICICEGSQKIGAGYHRPDCPAQNLYTPGPWKAAKDDNGRPYILSDGTIRVADCWYLPIGKKHAGEADANALLIAAAPDLLMALRQTLAALHGRPCRQQAIDDAMRAILKATLP